MASSLPSRDFQEGAVDREPENVLQKHVAFFDRNHDGLVYPWETFAGFRAIGAGYLLSLISSFFINFALSRKTRPDKPLSLGSLMFPIEIKNIQFAKHGSDSGVYDTEGRFVPSKFEQIFTKFAITHTDALTSDELSAMLKANREPHDYKGWVASWTEWKTLYLLCKDDQGLLRKETIRAVYDGSLFEQMERERSAAAKKKE
ncbi:putative peroxygenase 5 [Hibiscus syriacus]|uniref:Peroxygenase 5 n=1 Tax=Hibiscus syriacus TaxID=106335 RepID=A0A6A3BHK3_HIBSY|nr:probable peroxygenase 4 [Hibiscus syriacus]KAE8716143.1 putative peroxygenase 5 [Hibiscus syriacus]